ncbi:MAG: rubrerythrin family protein [Candidatus Thermoplasmatota archaeon]|nr:rubrerythrin family protein [Candidatus Thermoplasmatota archaeon]
MRNTIVVAIVICAFLAGALSAQEMRTRENLDAAFGGESRAHMNYLLYSSAAENEGFSNVSKLFYATSYAESIHARNHADVLGNIDSTSENLQKAVDGETYETDEMYPEFYEIAVQENNSRAQETFREAMEAEAVHAGLYESAKESVDAGRDMPLESVYVCPVCGNTFVNGAPDVCPICETPSSLFVQF